jgi:hypothetical protein
MLCVKSPKRLRYAESRSEGLGLSASTCVPDPGGATGWIEVTSEGDLRERTDESEEPDTAVEEPEDFSVP